MTTNTNAKPADRDDRAARYLDLATRLMIPAARAYDILDSSLDVDAADYDDVADVALHLLAVASYDSDDDFDDLRHDVRLMLGRPFADDHDYNTDIWPN